MRVGNGPKIDVECCQGLGYFMSAMLERAGGLNRTPAVIRRTQWLRNTIRPHRDYGRGLASFRARHKLRQERCGDLRHIAGQNQIPLGAGLSESCMYARERPAPWENVFNDGITKVSIPADPSDQSYVISHATCLRCNVFHQRTSLKWEVGFVAAHARTAPSSQYERGAVHAEMITLGRSAGII
jgi:hypothetical protein